MKRQLVTGDERVKVTTQRTTPCDDCPFSRGSLRGWLGGLTAQEWVDIARGESRMLCHTETCQCAGAAIFRANIAKMTRNQSDLRLAPDRKNVFASTIEFLDHHKTASLIKK